MKCFVCNDNKDLEIDKLLSDEYGFYQEIICKRCDVNFYSFGREYRKNVKEKHNIEMESEYRERYKPKEHIKEKENEDETIEKEQAKKELKSNNQIEIDTKEKTDEQMAMF